MSDVFIVAALACLIAIVIVAAREHAPHSVVYAFLAMIAAAFAVMAYTMVATP